MGGDFGLHQTVRIAVLLLCLFQAVQKRFGFLDLLLDTGDGGLLGIGDILGGLAVLHRPGNLFSFRQLREIIGFCDAQLLKGHRGVLDALLGSAIGKNGGLVKEGYLLGLILLGFGSRHLRLTVPGKCRKQVRLITRICAHHVRHDAHVRAGRVLHRRLLRVGSVFGRGFWFLNGLRRRRRRRGDIASAKDRVEVQAFLAQLLEVKCLLQFTHTSGLLSFFRTKKDRNRPYRQLRSSRSLFLYFRSICGRLRADYPPWSFSSALKCSALKYSTLEYSSILH